MQPFTYERVATPEAAIAVLRSRPDAVVIAGGTELLNWMKEGIARPAHLIDINHADMSAIEVTDGELRIGALARMSDVAAHPEVRRNFPAIAESLELSASPQLRNMASMGGNLLQRTRCPYFRADSELPCNKRRPGSGCAAREGENRTHAILGWSEACVATHPSDVAVVLAALDTVVDAVGPRGARSIPVTELHRLPGDTPNRDTVLEADELIVRLTVPRSSAARQSRYVKLRERASYEFALVSAAAAVAVTAGEIRDVRLALGGVAHKPWRLRLVEDALRGQPLTRPALRSAVAAALVEARPLTHNGFKRELATRAAVRTLELAGGLA